MSLNDVKVARPVAGFGGDLPSAGIWIALVNAALSLSAASFTDDFSTLRLLACASFALLALLLLRRLNNILFLARTLFLGGIGYYPMLIKVIAGAYASFSFYEPRTQELDVVVVMYVGTSLALLGSEIGLYFGSRRAGSREPAVRVQPSEIWRSILYGSVPVVMLVTVLTASLAPTVFDMVYAQEAESQLLGNTQNIGIIGLLAFYVAAYKLRLPYRSLMLAAMIVAFLVWAMFLRGLRQDVVTAVFGLLICHALVRGKEFSVKGGNLILALIFVVIVEFMGLARQVLATGITIGDAWAIFSSTAFQNDGVFHFGTVSPIATTYANCIYLVDTKSMDMLLGKSFAEFIPRTPPEFLYPDRPRDYAWIFTDYELGAGGGIFELGEAYLNFGLIGTLLLPTIISFLLAKSFYAALYRQNALYYFLLFTFLGAFLRGTWYQVFAFYKSFLTAIILLFVFVAVHLLLQAMAKPGAATVSLPQQNRS